MELHEDNGERASQSPRTLFRGLAEEDKFAALGDPARTQIEHRLHRCCCLRNKLAQTIANKSPREAALGAKHPHTLDSVNNLAFMLKEVSRKDEATQLIRAARKDRKATLARAVP